MIHKFEEFNERVRNRMLNQSKISREELAWAAARFPDMKLSEYKRQREQGKIKYEKEDSLDISKS